MKCISSYVIISLIILSSVSHAQNRKMERLKLQYLLCEDPASLQGDSLALTVAERYVEEGNYARSVEWNDKVKENDRNRGQKYFVSGKSEFLNDNFEGSVSFFDAIDPMSLNKERRAELYFYRALNRNHLLERGKVIKELHDMMKVGGRDTSGLCAGYFEIRSPVLINIRKARRRSLLMPGSGLYYAGEKRKGVNSFIVNLLCLGYTGYSVYSEHYITAVLTGAAQFMRFYSGGKRATVKVSGTKNREAYLKYVLDSDEYIRKKYFECK